MTNQIIKIVNATTGEEVQREMNKPELEILEQDKLRIEAREQSKAEKAQARLAAEEKLLALGLTTEDLKALLG